MPRRTDRDLRTIEPIIRLLVTASGPNALAVRRNRFGIYTGRMTGSSEFVTRSQKTCTFISLSSLLFSAIFNCTHLKIFPRSPLERVKQLFESCKRLYVHDIYVHTSSFLSLSVLLGLFRLRQRRKRATLGRCASRGVASLSSLCVTYAYAHIRMCAYHVQLVGLSKG